jgi:4-diphosphocytidyl-2-C-methyl-D-erythritol kinase
MAKGEPPETIRLDARAKINLGLEVVRKRLDGYHEIRSLMQSVRLADRLEIFASRGRGLRLRCPGSDLPCDSRNLVIRAAEVLRHHTGTRLGARFVLHKRIPIGAGLGGGSSDAAAALVGLNRLWRLRLPHRVLEEMASEIGSDVAFFIRGGTQLATGRGERLHRLQPLPRMPVLLVHPTLFVSTASVYRSRKITLTPLGPLTRLHHCDLATPSGIVSCVARLRNDLESVVLHRHRRIAKLREELRDPRIDVVRVSGSGSSLFLLCEDRKVLHEAMGRASAAGCQFHWSWFARRGWVSVGSRGVKVHS